MIFSKKPHNRLNFVALVVFPALAILALSFDQDVIAGALMAAIVLLGLLLFINTSMAGSKSVEIDGYLDADGENELSGHPNLKMVITRDPHELLGKKQVVLAVGPAPATLTESR